MSTKATDAAPACSRVAVDVVFSFIAQEALETQSSANEKFSALVDAVEVILWGYGDLD